MNLKTPEQVLEHLIDGNRRFVEGRAERPRGGPRRRDELVGGQNPIAAVFGCADSRVPPELIFDQGLGDLFVVRGAGYVADDTNLGSLEFAVAELGVPLILVLGHENCGAVRAAVASAESGHAPEGHVAAIVKAIDLAGNRTGSSFDARVDAIVRDHTRQTADRVRNAAPVLTERIASGELRVAAAVYRLADGQVEILD
jgi:carbonic anhydrase